MSILKIARMGHPILRTKLKPVPQGDIATPAVQRLVDDMIETMLEYNGAGLAAPQVHETTRVFVARMVSDDGDDDEEGRGPSVIAILNPEIAPVGRNIEQDWEGCLSIPDIRGLVPRYRDIRVRGLDRRGERIEIQATGYMARAIQHETDHLDGILFLDRMKTFQSLSFIEEYARYHAKRDEE
jgi:peptide deformylase